VVIKNTLGTSRFRMVTHYGSSYEEIDATLVDMNEVMERA